MQLSSEKWIAVASSEQPDTYRGITALDPAKKNRLLHSEFAQVVWKMEDDERSPDCEARANLILAGPELLAALKRAVNMLENDYIDEQKYAVIKHCQNLIDRLEGDPL